MRETIGAVVRKPVFRIKLIAISLLFVVSLIEQVSNNYIQSSGQSDFTLKSANLSANI